MLHQCIILVLIGWLLSAKLTSGILKAKTLIIHMLAFFGRLHVTEGLAAKNLGKWYNLFFGWFWCRRALSAHERPSKHPPRCSWAAPWWSSMITSDHSSYWCCGSLANTGRVINVRTWAKVLTYPPGSLSVHFNILPSCSRPGYVPKFTNIFHFDCFRSSAFRDSFCFWD